MSKIKIVFYLVLVFIIYKGYVAFKDFDKLVELHSSLHKNCRKILNEKN